jgi:hypothetical protein
MVGPLLRAGLSSREAILKHPSNSIVILSAAKNPMDFDHRFLAATILLDSSLRSE